MLPTYLMEGPLTWPGQHAGFLGPRYDPLAHPPRPQRRRLPRGQPQAARRLQRRAALEGRRHLLDQMAATRDSLSEAGSADPMADQREVAYSMLLNGKVARAFDLKTEDPRLRDRYGRHSFGQSLLLARRLVEAGVPIVQANLGAVQTWDSHSNIFRRLKNDLLPPTDRAISALLDDLQARGMLDDTLVVVTGGVRPRPPESPKNGGDPGPRPRPLGPRSSPRCSPAEGCGAGRRSANPTAPARSPRARPTAPDDLARDGVFGSGRGPRIGAARQARPAAEALQRHADRAFVCRRVGLRGGSKSGMGDGGWEMGNREIGDRR